MAIHKLTAGKLAKLLAARKPGKYGDGGGLYLMVTPRGTASWAFRYQPPRSRERCMGLGSVDTVNPVEAREAARQCRLELLAGRDPLGAKQGRSKTFEACFREFWEGHKLTIGNQKQRTNYENSMLKYAVPVIGSVPVNQISQAHVLRAVEPLWLTKTRTMRKVRQRIERVLDWATTKGFREGDNPAQWRFLQNVLPSPEDIAPVKHHPALDQKEMPAFMVKLREAEGPALLDRRALELTILTAVRTGDIIGQRSEARPPLRWADVDLDRGEWRILACKVGKPHTVALSDRAVEILHEVRDLGLGGDVVFPIGKNAMRQALQEIVPTATVHGFRASFRSWAHACTTFPRELVEECLSHRLIGDDVELAYLRTEALERRRGLTQAWANHCAGIGADNVVPLRAA
jgi:integrase